MASHSDIERQLYTIFTDHPNSHVNESGEPVIPADALVDVFRSFSDVSNVPLLSDEETDMLKSLLANNPGLEVTPSILLQFIAEKTRHSPSPGPPEEDDGEDSSPHRGRNQERQLSSSQSPEDYHQQQQQRTRSLSDGSSDGHYYSGSRPSSRGPPHTPSGPSIFDVERRQRSTPLTNAPSSWGGKRPAPAARRKSLDGNRSDSEFSASPTAFTRSTSSHHGRTRAPSNPVSPSGSTGDISFSPIGSPTFSNSFSRPQSRSGSASAYTSQHFGIFGSPAGGGRGGADSDDEYTINNALLNVSGEYRSDDSFRDGISSLPMPSSALDSDSDASDDEQDTSLGLVLDRATVSSTASMEPLERLEALQRTNTDLGRKLMEAERTLQNRLAEHESELEEMQGRLEEMRSELSATKREEKELRSKERQNITQISALEIEVAKVTKALEHAKSTYTSLQRQYQEQCSASEKYRDDLRHREELIRSLREASSLHEVELGKWAKEQQGYEDRIAHLEDELGVAQGVYVQLDEQKQENLLLKETIDRMRFEMDEMRGSAGPVGSTVSGGSSAGNTISKSLGAELMGKMKWGEEEESDTEEGEGEKEIEEGSSIEAPSEGEGGSVTAVEFEDGDDEDEDVIQTIITRKKRKVASRAKELNPSSRSHTFQEMEELKEYSDIAIQYDPTLVCVSSGVQTLPPPIKPTTSFAAQTEPPPRTSTFAIQTDTPPLPPKVEKLTTEMEIQTDAVEEEAPRPGIETPTPEGEESLASSSSTILPPTPKAQTRGLPSTEDEPPTYNQVAAQRLEEEKERKVVSEALSRWHLGAKLRSLYTQTHPHPHTHAHSSKGREEVAGDRGVDGALDVEPIKGGVAEELVEEWKALKEELGVECLVIDKIIENSTKVLREPASPSPSSTSTATDKGKRRSGRFFNIYNTYVYGSSDASSTSTTATSTKGFGTTLTSLATQTLLFASASAVVFIALTPYIPYLLSTTAPVIPGGASMYDRAAWASFNTLGGGAGEGIAFSAAARTGASAGFAEWFGWGGGLGAAAGAGAMGGNAGGGVLDGQTTEAVWKVLERVGGGAARIARGWPT